MVRSEFEKAMARATTDISFRVRLLTDACDALSDYGLLPNEFSLIEELRDYDLPSLASHLLIAIFNSRMAECDLIGPDDQPFEIHRPSKLPTNGKTSLN